MMEINLHIAVKRWTKLCYLWLTILIYLITVNPSIFAQQNDYIQYTIQDDMQANKFIGNIVKDSELEERYTADELQLLSYVFLTQGIHWDYFVLDELSGEIKTAQEVDRDDICPQAVQCALRLDIAVQPSKYFEILKVVIEINDRNDNSPIFSKDSVSYEFSESTSPGVPLVPIALAKDIDSPKYGVVKYELKSDTDVFELDVKNSSGSFEVHLTLKNYLDREIEDHYRLLVLAKDGGTPSRTGTLTINIHVLDINDNNPKFESTTYEVNIPENLTPGTSIITIKATDEDVGKNGDILYSFNTKTVENIKGTFTIERATGMIYLQKALDYEVEKFYSLIIVAQDQGPNSLPANTRVLVNIMDVNDHAPVIIMNTLPENKVVEIEENQHPEVIIGHISIYDEDSGTNGHVECFLKKHDGKFQIVEMYEKEFKIVTTKKLDRETQSKYALGIECKDYGQPQLNTKDTITVIVKDLNDNTPEFSQSVYNVIIQEHNEIGASLITVTAVDHDAGNNGRITYAIDQSDSHLFEINPQTGEINTLVEFDREVASQKVFHVIATDNGVEPKSSSASVKIDVLDIDDQVPRFTKHKYNMNVLENKPSFTVVGYVKAIDSDSPQNSVFKYYLEHNSDIGSFKIDANSGKIETKRVLDREKKRKYKLFVIAQSDNSPNNRRDRAEVDITVSDMNDNNPLFIFPSKTKNTSQISNNAPIGSFVTTLIADDNDSNKNAELTYTILEGNRDGYFELNPETGVLTIKKDISSLYSDKRAMKVLVEDSGEPTNMDIGTLYIIINSTVGDLIPGDLTDPKSVKVDPVSGDLLAVIVGCVCGAVVIILAVVLAIIIFMRRKKQSNATQMSWYTAQPSATASKDDLVMSDDNGTGSNDSSRKLVLDDFTDDTKKSFPLMSNGDVKNNDHYLVPTTLLTSSNLSDEKDNDSGCADLSQGSNDDHTPTTTSLVHLKHHHTTAPLSPCKRDHHNSDRSKYGDNTIDRTKYGNNSRNHTLSRPYIDPIPPSSRHHNVSPSLQKSFAEWLNSEGQQLKNQGHKYRVSHHHTLQPPKSPRVPVRNGSMKKTVRFTEPESSPNLNQGHMMIPSYEDYEYEDFEQDVKPSKSDGSIYNNMFPDVDNSVRHYGSLDRRRGGGNNVIEQHKRPVIVYTDHNGSYDIGHNNDGSLV